MALIRIENQFLHTFFIITCSLFIFLLVDFLFKKNDSKEWLINQDFYSSIWCHGTNHTNRRCKITNLCFKSNTQDFVFIHHLNYSIQSHVPVDRFSSTLLDFSSVINHNQYYFNYIQIDAKAFDLFSSRFKVKWLKKKTFIFGRFKPDNLMHLFHDDILPLYWTLKELDQFNKIDNIFLFDRWPEVYEINFNSEIYKKVFFDKKIITSTSLQGDELICFDEAFIGPNRETTWYQYGFYKPQGPINKNDFESNSIAQVCTELRQKFKLDLKCSVNYGLFISRKSNRLIVNEDKLIDLLASHLPIIKIDIESGLSLTELIEKTICSQLLIGIHGSGLIMSIFMEPGTDLIELFPFGINPNYYTPFQQLAFHKKINYQSWVNLNQSNTFSHPEYSAQYGGIKHFSNQMQVRIKSSKEVIKSYQCCDHPLWLYRIYQDTFVDLEDFKQKIKLSKYSSLNSNFGQNFNRSIPYYPGKVVNIKCIFQNKNQYRIEWNIPWNFEYIPKLNVQYEILIESELNKATSFFTHQTFIIVEHQKSSFNFWIRGYNGPNFGSFEYSSCSKNSRKT